MSKAHQGIQEANQVYWELVPSRGLHLPQYLWCNYNTPPTAQICTNKFILSEIAYQTILQRFNASLAKDARKKTCIPCNFHLGQYGL